MLKIALIFHLAKNDNLGVGALTVSEVEILRTIAQRLGAPIHITVIDGDDPRPPCVAGPDVTVLAMRPIRNPLSFFRVVRANDMVVDIGGGDSFADIYGGARFAKMMLMKYLVHLAGRPLVLAPQTIGPFKSRIRQFIAAQTIRLSAIVATRDAMSTKAARAMGIKQPIIEASDVALRLPYTVPESRSSGPVRVGINISGLLMSGGYTRNNMFGLQMDYRQLVRDIITRFQAHPDGCEIHLVPHVIAYARGSEMGAVEDDYQASVDIAKEFPGVIVAPVFATPPEAKSYIAGLDFFMGARMHACIGAFSSGVPVVPMAYSRKFAGLFGTLGYDHTVDCTTQSAEVILEQVFAAYADRAVLAAEARVALARGREKLALYEEALGALMQKLAAKKG
jgi:polysaccharide pyruvyl transferase WcaK-like protein